MLVQLVLMASTTNRAIVSPENLAVKIALLSLINDLPEPAFTAKFSPPNCLDISRASRPEDFDEVQRSGSSGVMNRMPLKHELLAAQQLAFILAYSGNPLHVLAVSCHEVHDKANRPTGSHCVDGDVVGRGTMVMIRVAANSGTHNQMIKGLRAVANILQKEADDGMFPSIYPLVL